MADAGHMLMLLRHGIAEDAAPGEADAERRLTGEGNSATDIQPTVDPLLLMNMSVWEDAESLFQFVYRTSHTEVMVRRKSTDMGTDSTLIWISYSL